MLMKLQTILSWDTDDELADKNKFFCFGAVRDEEAVLPPNIDSDSDSSKGEGENVRNAQPESSVQSSFS